MKSSLFIYLFICHIFSLLLFILGFLSIKSNLNNSLINNSLQLPTELNGIRLNSSHLYSPKLEKLVFIVIDALRADFVLNDSLNKTMPFLHSLHKKSLACSYLAHAHTPTVTLPRIKSVVTGGVPSFSDVIFNLGSSKMEDKENIIHKLESIGKKIVFFGDETWINLFPEDNIFLRKEGTKSFFVTDYTEVDLNVTRNLDFELRQNDWSVMILHYLGLDHIGHTMGPKSPLVVEKLKEMDDVIKKIYHEFQTKKTAIIICGDHGMSDSGSHGGSSKAEIEIPLTFIIKGCESSQRPSLQIDLVPTISILMGSNIPSGNYGSLIPGILPCLESVDKKLYAAFVNSRVIAKQFEKTVGVNCLEFFEYQRVLKLYEDWLMNPDSRNADNLVNLIFNVTIAMSSRLMDNLVSFDLYSMIIGISLSVQVLVLTVVEFQDLMANFYWKIPEASIGTVVVCLVSFISHICCCLSIDNKSSLCLNESSPIVVTVIINVVIGSVWIFNWIRIIYAYSSLSGWRVGNSAEMFLLSFSVLHCLSLSSSSYVEEEHQIYYIIVNTLAFILLCDNQNKAKNTISLLTFMLLLRCNRSWNQTGDKWINEPDVGDWLNESDHRLHLTLVSVCGAIGIFCWIYYNLNINRIQAAATAIGLAGSLAYRAALGSFLLYPKSNGIAEAGITYSSLLVIYFASQNRSSAALSVWIVLTSLLKRPHNLFLTFLQLVQYSLIRSSLTKQLRNPLFFQIAHYWIGMSWYFQQGNGNNLARIDLSSGYVGLENYNSVIVGFLLSCHTFAGPVLALLLAKKTSWCNSQLYGFLLLRVMIVSFFLTIVAFLRYHIFIWTVFSPKLIYESVFSVFILFIVIAIKFLQL